MVRGMRRRVIIDRVRLRFGLGLRGQMEVVGRAEAFLVVEELEEAGVKLVGGAEEIVEGGLENGAQGVKRQVQVREPAAGGQTDAVGGIELDGKAVEGSSLGTEELADFGDGSPGRSKTEGATEKETFPLVVRHEEEMGVVFLIQLEAGTDPFGGLQAIKLPIQALEDKSEGIKSSGRSGLHGGDHRTTPRTKTVRVLKGIGRCPFMFTITFTKGS